MTRSELISLVSGKSRHLEQTMVDKAMKGLFEYVALVLQQGDRIEIRGFGSFSVRYRKSRIARNPKTGAILHTEEKYMPYFKPGKELKERVNDAYLDEIKGRGL